MINSQTPLHRRSWVPNTRLVVTDFARKLQTSVCRLVTTCRRNGITSVEQMLSSEEKVRNALSRPNRSVRNT